MSVMLQKSSALNDTFAIFGNVLMGRRIREERNRLTAEYTDLIENADDRKLYDMGCTRHELYQMRDALYR